MSRELNPAQIWSQVPVANRLIEVNTKTGFSLTAGSYSVRASSTQHSYANIADATDTGTTTVSSVTNTRAFLTSNAQSKGGTTSTDPALYNGRITLTNSTTVTATRGSNGAGGNVPCGFALMELF